MSLLKNNVILRSVVLLCQVALPSMLFGSGKSLLTIKGGTNADLAPSVDYFINVFKPILQKFGADFNCDVIRRLDKLKGFEIERKLYLLY